MPETCVCVCRCALTRAAPTCARAVAHAPAECVGDMVALGGVLLPGVKPLRERADFSRCAVVGRG
jgi:hypothetical protein